MCWTETQSPWEAAPRTHNIGHPDLGPEMGEGVGRGAGRREGVQGGVYWRLSLLGSMVGVSFPGTEAGGHLSSVCQG